MQRVAQVGLGSIGLGIAARARRRAGMELVGGVDRAGELVGKDLGLVLGTDPLGVVVRSSVDELVDRDHPDVVLHATGSRLEEVADQLRSILRRGVNVVSTCEELSYPFYRHPELSRTLDEEASEAGAVLLGTGVNPGFVMDKLVATLMAACDSVRGAHVLRIVDAGGRREPFQRKIGAGLARETFEERKGSLGHVGLAESAHMLADVIGVGPRREIREQLQPVVLKHDVRSQFVHVAAGRVAGIEQLLVVESEGVERIRMELQMYIGAPDPRDAVRIDSSPPLEMTVSTGVPGDEATAAIAVHCAGLVKALEPGLRTMLDLPLRPTV